LDCLAASAVDPVQVDLGDAQIVAQLLGNLPLETADLALLHAALAAKDSSALATLTQAFPTEVRTALATLITLYGPVSVLDAARQAFAQFPGVLGRLEQLQWLAGQLGNTPVSFDLADARGYAYYSGVRFAIFSQSASDALVRGGRYDEVGAVFGRKRPAVGFSLDVKSLVAAVPRRALRAAVRAGWVNRDDWRKAVAGLRRAGETVVCVMPGHESEVDEFFCDRELTLVANQWIVQTL
jgi:ATP phosphoribosyltransferase regulatory subunit